LRKLLPQAAPHDDGWYDDGEALAALPHSEAEAAAKRKEEERGAEQQRLEAPEKKRNTDTPAAAQPAKDAKDAQTKGLLQDDLDPDGGLFNVEAANRDSQYTDFKTAAD
jgi:hypothetical protein